MKTWSVQVPITGYILNDVQAETKEAAIKAAMEAEYGVGDIEEWDTHRVIARGNICYATVNEVNAELIDDNEE